MHNVFEQELAALELFTEILQREQAALVKADVATLTRISEEKLQQADRLNQLAHERTASLQSLGVSDSQTDIQTWLSNQPARTAELWNKLLKAAKVAQHLNQTNGKLIEIQLQHNQQAMRTLMNAANQSAVYGADGQPRSIHSNSQRILGKG